MRTLYAAIIFFALTTAAFGQDKTDSLQLQLNDLSGQIKQLKSDLQRLRNENNYLKVNLDTANARFTATTAHQANTNKTLSNEINQNNQKIDALDAQVADKDTKANDRITTLDNSLSTNTLYSIIAGLIIALISLIVFVILRKQIFKEKAALSKHINEEAIKLDTKLMEVMETQLHLMKEERASAPPKQEEIDHSLALKVADEIVRIQTNLSRMDDGTKGLKQLASSVRRIKDNFEANGYEMVDMLNQPYNEGMKVVANFRPDETLEAGKQIITRIIKPQVNFKGVMIQSAQIEVSQGE